jgi:hypothetical protein
MSDVIKIDGVEIPVEAYQKLLDAGMLNVGQKHDVLSPSPNIQVPHGFFQNQNVPGLFTRPGADADMFAAFVMPTAGQFLSALYRGVTNIDNPEYDIISGVKAGSGTNATDYCGDAPTAGEVKLCTTRATFADFFIKVRQANLAKTGGRINNSDVNRNLVNRPDLFPLIPDVLQRAQNPNTTLGLALFSLGVHMSRVLMRTLFHGSTANTGNNAELGFIREFNGFDRLITNTVVDVEGNTCAAARSTIFNWGNADVGGTVQSGSITDIVAGIMYQLIALADDSNIAPVNWVLAMHPDLFWKLTSIWPCSYLTNGCAVTNNDGERLNVSADMQVQMRDEMRTGNFLWVNGMRLPVVTTRAIEQTTLGQGFSSSIYFIPLTAMGRQVTYLEGFDLENSDIQEFRDVYNPLAYRTMNGGFYAMTHRQTGMCVEAYIAARPRLIMRTPWLAARIDNVNYSLPGFLYGRDPYPDAAYHLNGGRYFNANGPYYSPNAYQPVS